MADHVHILCTLGRTVSIAQLVKEIKRQSSIWIKDKWPDLNHFGWQRGYGVFSLSPAHVAAVENYVREQPRHHQKESFQEEYLRLLNKYHIKVDERYLWD